MSLVSRIPKPDLRKENRKENKGKKIKRNKNEQKRKSACRNGNENSTLGRSDTSHFEIIRHSWKLSKVQNLKSKSKNTAI